jgi:hypothetical protein
MNLHLFAFVVIIVFELYDVYNPFLFARPFCRLLVRRHSLCVCAFLIDSLYIPMIPAG